MSLTDTHIHNTLERRRSPEDELTQVWYTRCPVPTGSGLAYHLGWLTESLQGDGIGVGILQDGPPELARHHLDHELIGLFREGGNVPALAAKAQGADTRLIGLTWIDEWQKILVRGDSGVTAAAQLRGLRLGVPRWAETRAASFPRAMALHGYKQALELGGLSFDDIDLVELPSGPRLGLSRGETGSVSIFGLEHLAAGEVDAIYVKGAAAAEHAKAIGASVAVDLDEHPDRRLRVNNGTPRPLTVHQRILDERPELVVRFLVETLRAADWAATHLDEVRTILQHETRAGADGVVEAYRDGFHTSLYPTLSPDRLRLLEIQKKFLLIHGFLAADVDIDAWSAPEPLRAAQASLNAETTKS